jgi:hypothetical protein
MKTVRDEKIDLRIAGPLKQVLEDAARADDRTLSDIARRALVEFGTRHILERAVVE